MLNADIKSHSIRNFMLLVLVAVLLVGCARGVATIEPQATSADVSDPTEPVAASIEPTMAATPKGDNPSPTPEETTPPQEVPTATVAPKETASGTAISGLRVRGNQIVDGAGQTVRLLGVNHSGTEYACIGGDEPDGQGWGIFDSPMSPELVEAISEWGANVVRVPLNEDCWLGVNGAPEEFSGNNYQTVIKDYVEMLNEAGLVAIVELHWTSGGTEQARGTEPMPNREQSVEFWKQVATQFQDNSSVIFDLFNEPYPDDNEDTDEAWRCWRDGGKCRGVSYEAAGMQELVDAVRSTGAKNIILLGGVQYANSLSRWLEFKPNDPENNLGAAWHVYDFNRCKDARCWDRTAGVVAKQVPLVAGEIGQEDKDSGFTKAIMQWHDSIGASYLAWVWNTWGSNLDLIEDYDGTPTEPYGKMFKEHLQSVTGTKPDVGAGRLPIRINAGGDSYTDGKGQKWAKDDGYSGGEQFEEDARITGTKDGELYQNERFGDFSYAFKVPNGRYTVTLKFAELYWTEPSKRIFTVEIEGEKVLSDFDILAKGKPRTALDRSFNVEVTDGSLDMAFAPVVDNATVAGIEIIKAEGAAAP